MPSIDIHGQNASESYTRRTTFVDSQANTTQLQRCISGMQAYGRHFVNRNGETVSFNGLDFDLQCGYSTALIARNTHPQPAINEPVPGVPLDGKRPDSPIRDDDPFSVLKSVDPILLRHGGDSQQHGPGASWTKYPDNYEGVKIVTSRRGKIRGWRRKIRGWRRSMPCVERYWARSKRRGAPEKRLVCQVLQEGQTLLRESREPLAVAAVDHKQGHVLFAADEHRQYVAGLDLGHWISDRWVGKVGQPSRATCECGTSHSNSAFSGEPNGSTKLRAVEVVNDQAGQPRDIWVQETDLQLYRGSEDERDAEAPLVRTRFDGGFMP